MNCFPEQSKTVAIFPLGLEDGGREGGWVEHGRELRNKPVSRKLAKTIYFKILYVATHALEAFQVTLTVHMGSVVPKQFCQGIMRIMKGWFLLTTKTHTFAIHTTCIKHCLKCYSKVYSQVIQCL